MDRKNTIKKAGFIILTSLFAAATASAQDLGSIAAMNMNFDNQFNATLSGLVQQNQASQQALIQNYIAQFGPQLRQQWQQSGAQVPFEQFVQWHIMTQGGTNYGPALQVQQDQFKGWQSANATVQSGYNSYNQGYWQNQATLDSAAGRFTNEAINGNAGYVNPQTGEAFNLPYYSQPGVYTQGFNTFGVDNSGNYHQIDPLGYTQQLDGNW